MCIIAGIAVIDQFTYRHDNLIYILTHWHSDHYQGIYNGWNHGPIFASKITRQLLLTKYPKMADKVQTLPLRKWINICQNSEIRAFAFDSNHMAGSIMVLLNIDSKYYLHTGDMRFNPKIAQKTPEIFSPRGKGYKINYDIQELHLDNTFCDPIFKFPTRSKAIRMIIDLLKETKPKRLFLCTDSVGKEEAFILLAKYHNVRVAVSQSRMAYIKAMDFDQSSFFTLNPEVTWIQVISKSEKEKKICQISGSIAITLTGWANLSHPYPEGERSYLVPYSLHSNFKQMQCLVKWVRPKRLIGVVREDSGKWQKLSKSTASYKGYMFSLMGVKQRGMDFFREEYCQKDGLSQQKENIVLNKTLEYINEEKQWNKR